MAKIINKPGTVLIHSDTSFTVIDNPDYHFNIIFILK